MGPCRADIGLLICYSVILGTAIPSKQRDGPNNPVITPSDPRYPRFSEYANILKASMDLSLDPCNNFYEYVCKNEPENPVEQTTNKNIGILIHALENPPKFDAMNKFKQLYDKTVEESKAPSSMDFKEILDHFTAFQKTSGVEFPALSNNKLPLKKPSKNTVAKLAAMSTGPSWLVGVDVHPYQKKVSGGIATLMVTAPQLLNPELQVDYLENWDTVHNNLKKEMTEAAIKLAELLKITNYNKEVLEKDIEDVLRVEKFVADKAMPPPMQPDAIEEASVELNLDEATQQSGLVDFRQLARDYVSKQSDNVKQRVESTDFKIFVNSPDSLKTLDAFLNSDEITPRTFYNYLFFHLVEPWYRNSLSVDPAKTTGQIIQEMIKHTREFLISSLLDRLYLSAAMPDPKRLSAVRDFTNNIITGFRTEVNALNWPNVFKQKTGIKLENMAVNIGYDQRVLNDTYLNEYYKNFIVLPGKEADSLPVFVASKHLEMLALPQRDRADFSGTVAECNAVNNAQTNSINIYASILQSPFYDPDFPAAVNYGGIGVIVGHEVVHSFDNTGIKYDEWGYLNPWLDPESSRLFENMSQCVIQQYNNFTTSQGWPINGTTTITENIADSGGIRGSFNAFRAHKAKVGDDPRLPIDELSRFTSDQLFFISMARTWCGPEPATKEDMYKDNHSPVKARVLGSLQNFPEFKKAFNCKAGDYYAPVKHCNVYAVEEHDC